MFGAKHDLDRMHGEAVSDQAAAHLADLIANAPPEFRDYLMQLLATLEDDAAPVIPDDGAPAGPAAKLPF